MMLNAFRAVPVGLVICLVACDQTPTPTEPPAAEPDDQASRVKMVDARYQLSGIFQEDPEARVPAGDLGLPPQLIGRLDQDGDGIVTFGEAESLIMREPYPGPRDGDGVTLMKEDGYPLNVGPESVSAADAPIGDDDMVIGIVIDGEPRAYPIDYMNGPHNEVVNDTLGGEPIAASW